MTTQLAINPMTTICFTGHRPKKLGGYYGQEALRIQGGIHNKLYELVKRALGKGYTHFIQGGAQGVDQIAGEVCIRLRREGNQLVLITAKPFPSQNSKWPDLAQARYQNVLDQSNFIVTVSQDPFTNAKMFIRNRWMIDNSGSIIAVYDGTGGGTGHAVGYAREKKRILCIVHPLTLKESWEVLNDA